MTAQDLKNAILQLAVQGKLVPQDPNDEPASELLKRIEAEKEQQSKEGLVSIDKKHTPSSITEDDIPYDIPDTWSWVKFADIAAFYSGKTPERHTAEYWNNGEYTWVSIADMVADGITVETKEKITKIALSNCFSGKMTPAGTMIMSFKLTIGKISVLGVDAVHNEAIISIFPFLEDTVLKSYLFKILPLVANGGDSKNAIKGKTLNATSLSNLMIPLPPLAEQRRIIAKIEELMPLVEEYGNAEERLTALNAAFPDKLRKSILQQAIQGKLTERDPADEPASELLIRIRAEKERLVKEGKIKKEKPLPPITEEEIPFEIPENWIWVRLGEITTLNGGYAFKSTNYASSGVRVIRISDFDENGIINKNMVYHPFYKELREFIIEDNDILMCMTGGTVGKSCIIKKLNDICVLNQRVARIRFLTNIVNFGYLVLTSPQIQDIININKTSTNDNISMELIKSFLIPLPPLAEQQRIVDRVNELLAVCDGLK